MNMMSMNQKLIWFTNFQTFLSLGWFRYIDRSENYVYLKTDPKI